MEKKTSLFANGLVWFGAGVSIAEIITGTAFAPLGLTRGISAVLLGHLIGGIIMLLSGLIGAKTGKSAMETVKMCFGRYGGLLFCLLNIAQLMGWTSIMIYDGAIASNGVFDAGHWVWCLVIGALIIAWIMLGVKSLERINTVAMASLFILTLVLCRVVFSGSGTYSAAGDAMSFGAAVELAAAMPLSWLPVISDYTSKAHKPVKATVLSTAVYSVVSCWMYIIGMGAAAFAGSTDIAQLMLSAGLGIIGLVIVVFSTVTTTYLDAYSAGVSSLSLSKRLSDKWVGVAAAVLGTVLAVIFRMDDITDFLYLIGSVFAPMVAVQISDFFIFKGDSSQNRFNIPNLIIWVIGFCVYRLFMRIDTPLGSTLPAMLITIAVCVLYNTIKRRKSE